MNKTNNQTVEGHNETNQYTPIHISELEKYLKEGYKFIRVYEVFGEQPQQKGKSNFVLLHELARQYKYSLADTSLMNVYELEKEIE